MQYSKVEDGFMMHVEKGEKIMETITQFCKENEINNAQLSGIGAVMNIDIGALDINSKQYIRKNFKNVWELVSYQGNVSLKNSEPFIHAHVTIGNHDFNIKGGHLFEATVAAVGEFILRKFDNNVYRAFNNNVGLPTLCMENKL